MSYTWSSLCTTTSATPSASTMSSSSTTSRPLLRGSDTQTVAANVAAMSLSNAQMMQSSSSTSRAGTVCSLSASVLQSKGPVIFSMPYQEYVARKLQDSAWPSIYWSVQVALTTQIPVPKEWTGSVEFELEGYKPQNDESFDCIALDFRTTYALKHSYWNNGNVRLFFDKGSVPASYFKPGLNA